MMHNAITPANGEAVPPAITIDLGTAQGLVHSATLGALLRAHRAEWKRIDETQHASDEAYYADAAFMQAIETKLADEALACTSHEEAVDALRFVEEHLKTGLHPYHSGILAAVARFGRQ